MKKEKKQNSVLNFLVRESQSRLGLFVVMYVIFFSFNTSFASQSSGTIINSSYKQAVVCTTTPCPTFSGNYINFLPTSGGAGFAPITIDDTNGIDGYAFGNYLGWINFGRNATSTVTINTSTGAISGYAWAQNSGWINMAPSNYGVSINGNGEFNGYAWAAGKNGGWIKFDCSGGATSTCVKTDWVPTSARTVISGGGGGGGGGSIVAPVTTQSQTQTGTSSSNYLLQTGPQNQAVDFSNDYRADINDSGRIDILDFNILLVNWSKIINIDTKLTKQARCPAANKADVNCDGKVNIFDFNLVLVYWGTYVGDQGALLKTKTTN